MFAFLGQVIRNPYHVGALLPSSRWLARSMTAPVRNAVGPKRVLEVGPGSGAMTRYLLPSLRDGDELQLVEINERFSALLRERLLDPFQARRPGIRIGLQCESIQAAFLEGRFDFIVCSLPFNSFSPQVVRAIFRKLIAHLEEEGELTYFEYVGQRAIQAPVSSSSRRRGLRQLSAIRRLLMQRHHGRQEFVLWNVLPAYAVCLSGKAVPRGSRRRD